MRSARIGVLLFSAALTACASVPKTSTPTVVTREAGGVSQAPSSRTVQADVADTRQPKRSPYPPAQEDPSKRGDYVAGGLYAPHIKDSAPDEQIDVDAIPEPEVRDEPRSRAGNRTYSVLGRQYQIRASADGYVEEGLASFYGRKFHGRRTSNQEVYDMYAFTAAHKSLPLPSHVRVTNLDNGKSVVVRVNDRGPFHAGRVIDLSYAAAVKLDMIERGTARVEVRALMPDEREGRRETARNTWSPSTSGSSDEPAVKSERSALSADEFERWMQAQGIRIASGKPANGASVTTPATPSPTVAVVTPVSDAGPVVATPLPSSPGTDSPVTVDNDGVLLQLGAFGERDNAERARDRLLAGGIESVRLDEAEVNGRRIWRLRLGPVTADRVRELSVRVGDLGFGPVQVVRD